MAGDRTSACEPCPPIAEKLLYMQEFLRFLSIKKYNRLSEAVIFNIIYGHGSTALHFLYTSCHMQHLRTPNQEAKNHFILFFQLVKLKGPGALWDESGIRQYRLYIYHLERQKTGAPFEEASLVPGYCRTPGRIYCCLPEREKDRACRSSCWALFSSSST